MGSKDLKPLLGAVVTMGSSSPASLQIGIDSVSCRGLESWSDRGTVRNFTSGESAED